MRSRLLVTPAILTVLVATLSAQSGTADGVAALARGDYQRAVEILKPIAEDTWSHDTTAQFFMAGLYESGRGVPVDPVRACALYARAASTAESMFGRQATPLFSAFMSRGKEFADECSTLASIGFDTGFEPATFDLGPGHFVEWTLNAVAVTYAGQTKRQPMPLAMPGAKFLPLQHSELATGSTRSNRRHFIEVFLWYPDGRSGPWNLQWHLFEVVRDEIIRIDTPGPIVTIAGDAPPSRDAFDVRDYAVVRVDDDGDAEMAVLKGPHVSTERIETDAERREARETKAARDAALNRVDWNRRSDVHRQPNMTYVDADGCGWAELIGWSANRDEALVVRVTIPDSGSWPPMATLDLSRDSGSILVEAHLYERPQRQSEFCTDVRIHGMGGIEPEVWRAVAGTVSVELSPSKVQARNPFARRATVTLTNVVLRSASGTTIKMPAPVKLSAIVGAVFG